MASFESLANEVIALYKSYQENNTSNQNDLFEQFEAKFNILLREIKELKQQNYAEFMNSFQAKNTSTKSLYEFVSKLLNLNLTHNKIQNSVNHQIVIVNRSIELLHVIISGNC